MKSRFLVCLLAIVLLTQACNSVAPADNTPTAFPTSVPASLTVTTEHPTPTKEPTPTKDPNAPTEYTRVINGVYYLDKLTVNGNTLTYTWDLERKAYERIIFSGFMDDYSQKDINEAGMRQPDQLLTTVYIDGSIDGEMALPTLSHMPNTDPGNTVNFNSKFGTDLSRALLDRGIIKGMTDFGFIKWNARAYYLDFTNADGSQRWGLWPGSTITIYIRGDYDRLKQDMATNGFSEAKSHLSYGPENYYMVKIWSKNGSLFVDIAPSLRPATSWTEKQILEMIFFGPADVMEQADLTHPQSGSLLSEYVLNSKTLPYFTFGPPQ